MKDPDLILVVGPTASDEFLSHIPKGLTDTLPIVKVDCTSIPEGKAIIMSRDMVDKIDEIDFSKLQPLDELIKNDPAKVYPIHSDLSSLMPDMTPIFKEMDRKERQQQRETMKNISRYHSQRSKKFGF